MKYTLLASFIILSSISFSQNTSNTKDYKLILKQTKEIKHSKNSEIPSYIEFNKNNTIQLEELSSFLNIFSETPIVLKEVSRHQDQLGIIHVKFQQYFNSIPMELNYITAHIKKNSLISLSGNLIKPSFIISTATISESNALNNALQKIGASKYKWEIAEEEAFIKREEQNENATFYPKGKLVFLCLGKEIILTYKFDIYAQEPLSRAYYYVNAQNGEILYENKLIHHANSIGTASTAYSNTRSIVTDSVSTNSFRLRETGRGAGIETYDMNQGSSYGSAVDFTDNDNNWTSTTNLDQYALDAHWGAEMTYDYYWNVHARNSINGIGFKLKSYVHYNSNYSNAFWDGNRMTYGDGNGSTVNPLTTMAIAGHEITHGLTSNTANLVYRNESGAINESFSDIFGVCIDFWSRPSDANWLMGDEIYSTAGNYFRSMSNPKAKNDPDTYLGLNWYTGTADNGGVHTNSGVQNFWFYLLVNGGTGTNDNNDSYTVNGLGFDTASRIAFRSLTVYLSSNDEYSDARFYSIKAASDLYGACSPAVIATTNAWHAVGVGPAYVPGVNSDFTVLDSVGCTVPFTVNFTNTTNNASSFIWSFGDGGSTTTKDPSHTYTGFGPYTVELKAFGGTCGNDTIIKINHIFADTSKACPVILGRNNNLSSNKCSGSFFDNGGASSNYSGNQNSTFTISPSGASKVTLSFPQFDIEPGTSGALCDYDYMEIYDGLNASATLLGSFCNNNPPPASITTTGGNAFIKFHSDPGLHLKGFKVDWTCSKTSGIEEVSAIHNINIYPNPASNSLNIEADFNKTEYVEIKIIDLLGKTLYQSTSKNRIIQFKDKIDISNLAKGTYIISVNNKAHKFIKQ